MKPVHLLIVIEYPNRFGDSIVSEGYWPVKMDSRNRLNFVTDIEVLRNTFFPEAPPDPESAYEKLLDMVERQKKGK